MSLVQPIRLEGSDSNAPTPQRPPILRLHFVIDTSAIGPCAIDGGQFLDFSFLVGDVTRRAVEKREKGNSLRSFRVRQDVRRGDGERALNNSQEQVSLHASVRQ